jgi:hypothetical protein
LCRVDVVNWGTLFVGWVRPPIGAARPIGLEAAVKYLMLLAIDEDAVVDEADSDPRAWDAEMERRGIVTVKERLGAVSDATTVRVRGGEVLITDGPFAETKEQIGGFCLLECDDLDQAIEVASRHPMARFGSMELRPLYYQ